MAARMAGALSPRRSSPRSTSAPVRDGRYSPPPIDWEWKVEVLVTDSARAAPNAFRAVMGPEIQLQTCFAHAAEIWFHKQENKAHFRDLETNLSRVREDLQWLNTSLSTAALAPIAKRLMFAKWRDIYKEPDVATKFEASWGEHRLTRAEANENGVGGVPSDNNMLESKNRVIKAELERDKPTITTLIPRIASWIEHQAETEPGFGLEHNAKAVCGKALLESERGMEDRVVHLTAVCWTEPDGSFIIPSAKTITEAVDQGCVEEAGALKAWLAKSQAGYPAWLRVWRQMTEDPVAFAARADAGRIANFTWDFNAACSWSRAFRRLTPIEPVFAQELLLALERNGFTIEWSVVPTAGMLSCTCNSFMHYCLCKHSLAFLWRDGVITGWPKNRDPTKTQRSKRGRPAKSVSGGAKGRE
jgi:hypothetical protein